MVRAEARFVRQPPSKVRQVLTHLRGLEVAEARAMLAFTPRRATEPIAKVLESAVANAQHNHALDADELFITDVRADEGPTLRRFRPRARGRATRIRKRTSHITIILSDEREEGGEG